MDTAGWTGRWSVGCAVLLAGSLFFACFFPLLVAGDTIATAFNTAASVAGITLGGAAMFALLEARDERRRRKRLIEIRSRLEQRGPVSDDVACESVPEDARPQFLKVRAAAADFLGCPPEWLRAGDSLQTEYRTHELGSVDLEWHVVERLLEGRELSDPDRVRDNPVQGTLADLAEYVRKILDEAQLPEPPQTEPPEEHPPVVLAQIPINEAIVEALLDFIPESWNAARLSLSIPPAGSGVSMHVVNPETAEGWTVSDAMVAAILRLDEHRRQWKLEWQSATYEVRRTETGGWKVDARFPPP